jgi:hypothetical protein
MKRERRWNEEEGVEWGRTLGASFVIWSYLSRSPSMANW